MPTSDPTPEPTSPQAPAGIAVPPMTAPPTAPPPASDQAGPPTAAPPLPESPEEKGGRPLWVSWAIAGAVVAVLAGAAVVLLGGSGDDEGTANARTDTTVAGGAAFPDGGGRPGGGFGPGARGTITSIDGLTITVESNNPDGSSGTTAVKTTDETTIIESVDASLDDFEVGDSAIAFGEADDSGDVVASAVSESNGAAFVGGGQFGGGGQPPDGFQPPADGQLPDGFQPPADGQLPDGFQPPADGQLPDGFQRGQGGGGFAGQGAPTVGEITAIDDDSLTIESDDGSSVTVTVDDDTTFTITEDRSLDDLAEGDTIVATGETGDDDVLTATSIRIGDGGGFGPGGPGGPAGSVPGDSADTGEA